MGDIEPAAELFEKVALLGVGISARDRNESILTLLGLMEGRWEAMSAGEKEQFVELAVKYSRLVDQTAPLSNCSTEDCADCTRKKQIFLKYLKMGKESSADKPNPSAPAGDLAPQP